MLPLLWIQLVACLNDFDGDGHTSDVDCNDVDPGIYPGATETCDGRDENCSGVVDEGVLDAPTWYIDADGDGYGAAAGSTVSCAAPGGYVANNTDCDDARAQVSPASFEVSNDRDDDCDGTVDNDPIDEAAPADHDDDGFASDVDCDDTNADIHPEQVEACNWIDDNCDGVVDNDAPDATEWFADTDRDGYGDAEHALTACDPGDGYVGDATDCDDTDAQASPAGWERVNGQDDDCNGDIDDDAIDLRRLVTMTREATSTDCPNGGVRIDSGDDWNNDTLLSVDEIDDTQWVCDGKSGAAGPAVVEGSYTIQNNIDMALLAGVREIHGDLIVENTQLTRMDPLPDLEVVTGWVRIQYNPLMQDLDTLNNLSEVGLGITASASGDVHMFDALTRITYAAILDSRTFRGFGQLQSVDDQLYLKQTADQAVAFPRLTSAVRLMVAVRGSFSAPALRSVNVLHLAWVTAVDLPALESFGTDLNHPGQGALSIGETSVADLSWIPAGSHVCNLAFTTMPNLTDLRGAPAIDPACTQGSLFINTNPALSSLEGLQPSASIASVNVSGNPVLVDITALEPLDRITNQINISNNTALCNSRVDAAFAGLLLDQGASTQRSGNKQGC